MSDPFANLEPEFAHLKDKAMAILDGNRVEEPEKLEAALIAVEENDGRDI